MTDIDLSQIIVNSHWSDLLLSLGRYSEELCQFALPLTYQQFWETCPKGEWLLYWIIKEGSTPHKSIVHAACQCARLALPYCTDQQQRPLKAIETTEKWIRGEATLEEVKKARDGAWAAAAAAAAYTPSSAASYASSASYSASNAAYYAASDAASAASSAATYYAAPENQEAVRKSMQLQTADIVRSLIPRPDKMVKEYERVLELKAFL